MADMYGFLLRPKWIGFHLLVLAGIVTMVYLGFWQLDRLDQKQTFNARVEQRYDEPPVPLDELLVPSADVDDLEWRPVTVNGTFAADGSIQIVNRSQYGRAGENTVTPMRLDDGRVLLVNRGFLPLDIDPPAPPTGTVALTGRLRLSQTRTFGQLGDPADGVLELAQRVDIDRLSEQIDADVVPMYLDVYKSVPAESAPQPEPVIAPELDEGSHLSYAVQWFIFALAVAVGWTLAVRRSIRTHRAELESPANPITETESGTPESEAEAPVRLRRYTDH
ncbi:MAG TPA: SURF1 family protein [Ilumatobacter sp.]|nr:SURF1 family protein [Ilumatobacter sp.]